VKTSLPLPSLVGPFFLVLAVACHRRDPQANRDANPTALVTPKLVASSAAEQGGSVKLSSKSFSHNAPIPKAYTCQGADRSPPLSIHDVPNGTKSLVLIVDDPDAPDPKAPKMTWVHWVLYDLPPDTTELAEGVKSLPAGTREGKNDWKRTGYGGPCPPIGRHRYFHKLYALDVVLPDLSEPTKAALESAMRGHVIAQTELVGTYKKE
jgi:Raf kinase inhibitor-like YbhB/YbcL family protein